MFALCCLADFLLTELVPGVGQIGVRQGPRGPSPLIHPFGRFSAIEKAGPLVIVRGDGCRVRGERGKECLEAMSRLWCASLGFSEKRLAKAAGYHERAAERRLMRLRDVFMAFPRLVLALAIAAVLGAVAGTMIAAISITGWKPCARVAARRPKPSEALISSKPPGWSAARRRESQPATSCRCAFPPWPRA